MAIGPGAADEGRRHAGAVNVDRKDRGAVSQTIASLTGRRGKCVQIISCYGRTSGFVETAREPRMSAFWGMEYIFGKLCVAAHSDLRMFRKMSIGTASKIVHITFVSRIEYSHVTFLLSMPSSAVEICLLCLAPC